MVLDFGHATVGPLTTPVFRLGLSATYRPGRRAIHHAMNAGVNYFFCFGIDTQMIDVLREELPRNRERYVVSTGACNWIWGRPNLRRTVEKRLRQLRTDYIDVFHFLGILQPRECPDTVIEELHRLREEGLVRAVGISSHNRSFAADVAKRAALDVLMVRYNAAHPGAEQEVFPHVQNGTTGVVAYTATAWRKLLGRPRNWPAGVPNPTAELCYRFVLSNPSVDVCLTAPRNLRELEQNLASVQAGPLWAEEMELMRHFGQWIRDRGMKGTAAQSPA
jgi:aryl-alcohol dehydrogenase-like predicted oxidoreductase